MEASKVTNLSEWLFLTRLASGWKLFHGRTLWGFKVWVLKNPKGVPHYLLMHEVLPFYRKGWVGHHSNLRLGSRRYKVTLTKEGKEALES